MLEPRRDELIVEPGRAGILGKPGRDGLVMDSSMVELAFGGAELLCWWNLLGLGRWWCLA